MRHVPQSGPTNIRHQSAKFCCLGELAPGICALPSELSLCLIKYHAMKTQGGLKVQFHTLLTPATNGGERSTVCLNHFTAWKNLLAPHDRGWVGLRASLNVLQTEVSHPFQKFNPISSVMHRIA
jgi:hypothetical protein